MANDNQLGDGPIESGYERMMNDVAHALDVAFNGNQQGGERKTGFVLLVFPFGESDGRCNYISNGADRRDVLKLLKEQAARFEESIGGITREPSEYWGPNHEPQWNHYPFTRVDGTVIEVGARSEHVSRLSVREARTHAAEILAAVEWIEARR